MRGYASWSMTTPAVSAVLLTIWSMAAGASDIDVVLISDEIDSDEWHEFLTRLHWEVTRMTGNAVQIVEHSRESWAILVANGNALVAEVRSDGIALTDHTAVTRFAT